MILVFGDSHSIIWGNKIVNWEGSNSTNENIKVHHIGASIIHNLWSLTSDRPLKWGVKILDTFETNKPPFVDCIVLSIGEIDLRVHALKIIRNHQIEPSVYIKDITTKLIRFADHLSRISKTPVFIVSPIPSFPNWWVKSSEQLPALGSFSERLKLTLNFAKTLRNLSSEFTQLRIVDITKHLIDEYQNLKLSLYEDGIHLNQFGFQILKSEFLIEADYLDLDLEAAFTQQRKPQTGNSARCVITYQNKGAEGSRCCIVTEGDTIPLVNPPLASVYFDFGYGLLTTEMGLAINQLPNEITKAKGFGVKIGHTLTDLRPTKIKLAQKPFGSFISFDISEVCPRFIHLSMRSPAMIKYFLKK
jgi:hypothetical protein